MERGSWEFDSKMYKIIDDPSELGRSFSWVHHSVNQAKQKLAKQ